MKLTALFLICIIGPFAFATDPCGKIQNSVPEYDQATGALKGCKLKSVAPKSIYAQLGFKEGEIVNPDSSGSAKAIKINDTKEEDPKNH